MINFIVGLPTLLWVAVTFLIFLAFGLGGYFLGLEVGEDRGFRMGCDLGKRQADRQIKAWALQVERINSELKIDRP